MYPIQPTAFDYFITNFWFIYLVVMITVVFLLALASEESPATVLMNEITKLLGSREVLFKFFGIACILLLPLLPFATFLVFVVVALFELDIKIIVPDTKEG